MAFIDSYKLWTKISDKSVYAKFRRCLTGNLRETLDNLIDGETQTELEFGNYMIDWIEEEIGTTAFKY